MKGGGVGRKMAKGREIGEELEGYRGERGESGDERVWGRETDGKRV